MKKITLKALLFVAISATTYSQKSQGLYPKAIKFEKNEAPAFVKGKILLSADLSLKQRGTQAKSESPEVTLYKSEKDRLGYEHYRYQQTFNGIEIEGATLVQHVKNGKLLSQNGTIVVPSYLSRSIAQQRGSQLSEQEALEKAKEFIGAKVYKWELPGEEAFLKRETGDSSASFYPKAEKVYYSKNPNFSAESLRLTYKFDIYAHEPISRDIIYVDVLSGEILGFDSQIKSLYHEGAVLKPTSTCSHIANVAKPSEEVAFLADSNGTAKTVYSGDRQIKTQRRNGKYVLRETGRASGIETYNLRNGSDYGLAVDFVDDDNTWNNVNSSQDQYATDAHWGAEIVYEYYKQVFDRNSINDGGMKMLSYVHLKRDLMNAYWDGRRMSYGDGDNRATPLTALEIVGHEFTHGVTGTSSALIYRGESGALNEAYSDILGVSVEFWAKPNSANWLMGDQIGFTFRNMANPKAHRNPNTYGGKYWLDTNGCVPRRENDRCGVHINSGVLNYWFYLLSNGGSGTNDKGDKFNVKKIGMEKASAIAYRTNTKYLTKSSNYADARIHSITAAEDLYGKNSEVVRQVKNAFYAVGIGKPADGNDGGGGDDCANPNVKVTIKTDKYGNETSWFVKDKSGKIVLSSGGTKYKGYQTYTKEDCLVDGCYTFTVKDSYGDGMCCSQGQGSFSLEVNGKKIFSGSQFKASASKEFCISGKEEKDTQRPSVPTNLKVVKVTSSSIELTWNPSTDNVGVKGYNVYINRELKGNVAKPSLQLTKLKPGTTYAIKISAFDAAGNESYLTTSKYVKTKEDTASSAEVVVKLKTDNYASETSWTVRDSKGSIVMTGSNYSSNKFYTAKKFLNKGCYTFEIKDRYGDGICCSSGNGYYEVLVGGKTIGKGGSFRASESKQFCVGSSNYLDVADDKFGIVGGEVEVLDQVNSDLFTIYPNPVDHDKLDTITVKAQSINNGIYAIINSNGQVINSGKFNKVASLKVSGLPSGLYLVRVSDANKSLTKKLIIQ